MNNTKIMLLPLHTVTGFPLFENATSVLASSKSLLEPGPNPRRTLDMRIRRIVLLPGSQCARDMDISIQIIKEQL